VVGVRPRAPALTYIWYRTFSEVRWPIIPVTHLQQDRRQPRERQLGSPEQGMFVFEPATPSIDGDRMGDWNDEISERLNSHSKLWGTPACLDTYLRRRDRRRSSWKLRYRTSSEVRPLIISCSPPQARSASAGRATGGINSFPTVSCGAPRCRIDVLPPSPKRQKGRLSAFPFILSLNCSALSTDMPSETGISKHV